MIHIPVKNPRIAPLNVIQYRYNPTPIINVMIPIRIRNILLRTDITITPFPVNQRNESMYVVKESVFNNMFIIGKKIVNVNKN